jgi:hypothetical protein
VTLFLKACLGVGTAENWHLWRSGRPDLKTALSGDRAKVKRQLPLLAHALEREGIEVDEPTRAVLRLACLWEERRTVQVHAILAETLATLAGAGVTPVLLKGVALADTAYPKPALRHCHDVDLWVDTRELARAAHALTRIGFGEIGANGRRQATRCLARDDGLPINLHSELHSAAFSRALDTGIRARTSIVTIAGVPTRILSPPDTILQLCAQLAAGGCHSATWVADAVILLRARPLTPDDWRVLSTNAEDGGLALPLYVMLEYLRSEFASRIPGPVLEAMRDRVARTPAADRDSLLAAMRRGPAGRLAEMIRRSGWRSRLEIARWLLAPSPAFLRVWCSQNGLRWSPAWYVGRPVRGLALRAAALVRPGETCGPTGFSRTAGR